MNTKPTIKRPAIRNPYAAGVVDAEPPPLSWSVAPGQSTPLTLEMYVSIRVDDCDQAARFAEYLGRALAALPV